MNILKKTIILTFLLIILLLFSFFSVFDITNKAKNNSENLPKKENYWFVLHRKSNLEYLYRGNPGNLKESHLVKIYKVKTGVPDKSPTPLPKLLGRKYWLIVDKKEENENPETAPYFLTLNIPVSDEAPYGPTPYLECGGSQCDWNLPGYFGLHGVGGDNSRLSSEDPGSSGCIRHGDKDITEIYNLIDPKKEKIRYYVEDI